MTIELPHLHQNLGELGELKAADMSEIEPRSVARQRADSIKMRLGSIAGHMDHLHEEISAAYIERDWEALGYDDFKAYCDAEFETHLLRIRIALRREIAAELYDAGATTREIAAATGTSQKTADRDVAAHTGRPESNDSSDLDVSEQVGSHWTQDKQAVADAYAQEIAKATARGNHKKAAELTEDADEASRMANPAKPHVYKPRNKPVEVVSQVSLSTVTRLIEDVLSADISQDERRQWVFKLGEWMARFSSARK
jgi:hypothetical protein